MKKYFITILILSFFNYCCYSYYEISKEDIPYKKNDITKIEYGDKEVLYLDDAGMIKYIYGDSLYIVYSGSTREMIHLSEVNKLYETKINVFPKTIFFVIGVAFVSFVAFLFLLKGFYKT